MCVVLGHVLAVLSDGVFEAEDATGTQFGCARVEALLHAERASPAPVVATRLLAALRAFAGDRPQGDDVTMVFVKRSPAP